MVIKAKIGEEEKVAAPKVVPLELEIPAEPQKPVKQTKATSRFKREVSEFEQKVIDLRRVARVVAGGNRFKFRAAVVVGNKRGKVGLGVAKGDDVSFSVEKAVRQAKKNIINVPIVNGTIPHELKYKFGSAYILLKPARSGRGIVAGGALRAVFNLSGIENISAKILSGSKNKLNNAKAAIGALKALQAKS